MKSGYWLRVATQFLQSKSITTARLDCMVLLADTLQQDKAWVLAHPEYELSDAAVAHLQKLLSRRASHEPLAYIRGKAEFYGRTFAVSPAVLVPRPESETMIELLLDLDLFNTSEPTKTGDFSEILAKPTTKPDEYKKPTQPLKIADIGTGSGALGITAALELESRGHGATTVQVTLTEIDHQAIKVAQFNVDKLSTGISIIQSDLLTATPMDYDILLCNLPYVPDDYPINKAATREPKLALFAGADGLDLYRELFAQSAFAKKRPLFILTESLPEQHAALAALARKHGYLAHTTADFIQVFSPIPV